MGWCWPGCTSAWLPPVEETDRVRVRPVREVNPASPAVIVIFGAAVRPDGAPSPALRARVLAALDFAARLAPPPVFVPTGGIGRYGPAEAEVMAALLTGAGVAPERIVEEPTGRTTLFSVRAVRHLLARHGHRGAVFAATSSYHLPRCLLLLRLAGLVSRPVLPAPPAGGGVWLRCYAVGREVLALPRDACWMAALRLCGRV